MKTSVLIYALCLLGLLTAIVMFFYSLIARRIRKKYVSKDDDVMYTKLNVKNPECKNPDELRVGEVIFSIENGMYYTKTEKGYVPLISENNHINLLQKYGIERTLEIVNTIVSMKLYNGSIRDIICYRVSWELIKDKIISISISKIKKSNPNNIQDNGK